MDHFNQFPNSLILGVDIVLHLCYTGFIRGEHSPTLPGDTGTNPKGDLMSKSSSSSISPVSFIDAMIGSDSDGLPIWATFAKGDIVVSNGKMYRIDSFTVSNNVIVKPHGLGHDPMIASLEFRPESIKHLPNYESGMMHQTGLVIFS